MTTDLHHLELKLSGIRASADLKLSPAQIRAIQTDRATGAQFASKVAIASMTACQRTNPAWPQASKVAFATDAADAISACVHAI